MRVSNFLCDPRRRSRATGVCRCKNVWCSFFFKRLVMFTTHYVAAYSSAKREFGLQIRFPAARSGPS